MAMTHPDVATSFVALQTCQQTLQEALPDAEAAELEPMTLDDAHDALGQQGWRAISAHLQGLNATLTFALAPESAAMLLDGEVDETGDDPLGPLFDRLGELIGQSLGLEVSHGAVQEVSCEEISEGSPTEPPLFASLRTADRILGLLAVRYDDAEPGATDHGLEAHEFDSLEQGLVTPGTRSLELLNDVEMGVTAELGRTRLLVKDILALTPGSVIELNRAAGSPIDVLVNGTLIARGEVVVIDEEFGIRISEIVGYDPDHKGRRH